MKVVINQFFGIGDIIYCQGIAQELIRRGCEITWPVLPHYVAGLSIAYPSVHFVNKDEFNIDYERPEEHYRDGYTVIPLRWADTILGYNYNDCMRAKYDLIGISNADWREHAVPRRDRDREAELLSIIPEVRVDRQFSVANRYFGSELKMKAPGIPKCDVEMRPLNGYSLFDWLGVLEMADEIHTVSTSLIYLLESMNFMGKLHLYPRPEDPKFKHIDYLLTPELWTLHPASR